jgi:hypothetical protein
MEDPAKLKIEELKRNSKSRKKTKGENESDKRQENQMKLRLTAA